ncbi:hypothetical protein DFJ74DRAFT_715874 [Hyaloraphidium curvatum]|nr:hypothetical protein DFJ74DRAFT_715874 [Hyaloraphidium curvatum]
MASAKRQKVEAEDVSETASDAGVFADLDEKLEQLDHEFEAAQAKLVAELEQRKLDVLRSFYQGSAIQRFPDFWKKAVEHWAANKLTQEDLWDSGDHAALEDLKDVHIGRDAEDPRKVTVKFRFEEGGQRPFKNTELTKTVLLGEDEEGKEDGEVLERTELEMVASEPKGGSKRDQPSDVVFFAWVSTSDTMLAEMLLDFYKSAYRWFLGEVPESEAFEEEEGLMVDLGEDGGATDEDGAEDGDGAEDEEEE